MDIYEEYENGFDKNSESKKAEIIEAWNGHQLLDSHNIYFRQLLDTDRYGVLKSARWSETYRLINAEIIKRCNAYKKIQEAM